jgi:hypothetical protein
MTDTNVTELHPSPLPRVRGDGPCDVDVRVVEDAAPPRARGWSPIDCAGRFLLRGSPACAGMVPTSTGPRSRRRWLPRVRGDGPFPPYDTVFECQAPPRARGWSRQPGDYDGRDGGSPACAGMVPMKSLSRRAMVWLPRVRGDGPSIPWARCESERAPPRARGWSPQDYDDDTRQVGSPACAGMVPRTRLAALGLAGMAKAFDDQIRQPDVTALTFEQRLGQMKS